MDFLCYLTRVSQGLLHLLAVILQWHKVNDLICTYFFDCHCCLWCCVILHKCFVMLQWVCSCSWYLNYFQVMGVTRSSMALLWTSFPVVFLRRLWVCWKEIKFCSTETDSTLLPYQWNKFLLEENPLECWEVAGSPHLIVKGVHKVLFISNLQSREHSKMASQGTVLLS